MIQHFSSNEARNRFLDQLLGKRDSQRVRLEIPSTIYESAVDYYFSREFPDSLTLLMPNGDQVFYNLITGKTWKQERLDPRENYIRSTVNLILYWMKQREMNQIELSKRTGLPPATIHRILHGARTIDLYEACQIANVLDFDPCELIKLYTN